jgi:hypothetical protein
MASMESTITIMAMVLMAERTQRKQPNKRQRIEKQTPG